VDDEGLIHWPVIFIYPEVMENDIVEDFKESHTLKVAYSNVMVHVLGRRMCAVLGRGGVGGATAAMHKWTSTGQCPTSPPQALHFCCLKS